jgi:opacity protein-like surface antigen
VRWKLAVVPVLALSVVAAVLPVYSQVAYSAKQANLPFTVGTGFSNFSLDWGTSNPRMNGYTLWVDWRLPHMPPALHGLGIELEGRDVPWSAPASLSGHRMTTGSGGAIYEWRSWRKFPRIRPYAKFLIGFGSISFPGNSPTYNHDTRTVYEPGGGGDIFAANKFSIRAEYDYQWWPQLFGPNALTPSGFTVGAVYDFGRRDRY